MGRRPTPHDRTPDRTQNFTPAGVAQQNPNPWTEPGMTHHLAHLTVGAATAAVSVEHEGAHTPVGVVDVGPGMFDAAAALLNGQGFVPVGNAFRWWDHGGGVHVAAADRLWDR